MKVYTTRLNNLHKKTIKDLKKNEIVNIDPEILNRGGIINEKINVLTINHTGLGNNLFEICNLLGYAWDNNLEYCFPDINLLYSKIEDYPKDTIYRNLPINCNNENPVIVKHMIYYYNNFHKYKNKLLDIFSIDENSHKYIMEKYGELFQKPTISVHVRRGDFLFIAERWNKEYIVKQSYHHKALKYILDRTSDDYNILVFSNDIEWCRDNLIFKNERITTYYVEGNLDYIDLWLMSLCSHNIIESSTMSWWGAYFNKNPDKIVVCPRKSIFKEKGKLDVHNKKFYPEKWAIIKE